MLDIPLTVLPIAGTGDDMITWQALAGVGSYRLMVDGKWRSSSYDGAKTTWRVKRGTLPKDRYRLVAYPPMFAEGVHPPALVPKPPVLNNPIVFRPVNGRVNFFDAAGRDAIVEFPGYPLEQLPRPEDANNNAVVTLKNAPNWMSTPGEIVSEHMQTHDGQTGYGYGLYPKDCGTGYVDHLKASGPGLAQACVVNGGLKIVFVGADWSVMHPVWKKTITPGRPAEVHTDAYQSYGGPGVLEMYDCKIRTCGSITQVQPYKGVVAPMGLWKFHRPDFAQVTNPLSDEMPQAMTKDLGGGAKWPTEFVDCTLRPLGTPFTVSWVADEQAWQPGGTWNNTGQKWTVL